MRQVVALGLFAAAAGCNQFWGIGQSDLIDAADIDADPKLPRIKLTAQIAKTNPANGYVDDMLEYAPITPAPTVQLGLVDGELGPAIYEGAGTVPFPEEYLGQKWRLTYTIDGEPREIHWSPAALPLGHVVEPLFGRRERAPIPPGSGYTITPTGIAAGFQHRNTRVFTTGLWTEATFGLLPPAGATLDYPFPEKALSLSGPVGAPERAKFDLGVLADFQTTSGCRVATGVAGFQVPDLVEAQRTAPDPQPVYSFASRQVTLGLPVATLSRLNELLGSRSSGVADTIRWEYGYLPSLSVFAFSKPGGQSLGEFALPGPRMISFVDCTYDPGNPVLTSPAYADPIELRDRFPRVVHVEILNARSVNGAQLRSGLSTVVPSASDMFPTTFDVAGAKNLKLSRGGTVVADLSGNSDGVVLPAGAAPLELTFELEGALTADYYDITLYSVVPFLLQKQRTYTVSERTLTIHPAFLVPDTEYVFEVRSYRGRPDIVRSDFTVNSFPQSAATIFTRTFKTPP